MRDTAEQGSLICHLLSTVSVPGSSSPACAISLSRSLFSSPSVDHSFIGIIVWPGAVQGLSQWLHLQQVLYVRITVLQ
jgi:hypothetical protein